LKKILKIPEPDLKGRVVGREGRNIRALESCGVTVILDDRDFVYLESEDPVALEAVYRYLKAAFEEDCRISERKIIDYVQQVTFYKGLIRWETKFPYVIIDRFNNQLMRAGSMEMLTHSWNKLDPDFVKSKCGIQFSMFKDIPLFGHMYALTKVEGQLNGVFLLIDPIFANKFEAIVSTTSTYELLFVLTIGVKP